MPRKQDSARKTLLFGVGIGYSKAEPLQAITDPGVHPASDAVNAMDVDHGELKHNAQCLTPNC